MISSRKTPANFFGEKSHAEKNEYVYTLPECSRGAHADSICWSAAIASKRGLWTHYSFRVQGIDARHLYSVLPSPYSWRRDNSLTFVLDHSFLLAPLYSVRHDCLHVGLRCVYGCQLYVRPLVYSPCFLAACMPCMHGWSFCVYHAVLANRHS